MIADYFVSLHTKTVVSHYGQGYKSYKSCVGREDDYKYIFG